MNHLDESNANSIGGTLLTISLGIISRITASDFLVYVSILAGLVTIGYTVDKWYSMHKGKKGG